MFKKTAIAALVLGFTGAASAAMYAPAPAPACAAGNVTVPCERSAWDLGVDALYLRAEDNSLSNQALATMGRAKMGWGFRVEGSYHFGTGNDVSLSWARYSKAADLSGTGVSRLTNKFDIVNFEFGQQVDFGENVDMRFNAGVQWVKVVDQNALIATPGTLVADSELTGFGPRVGAAVKYDFGNGFGVYVDSAVAVLAAKMENKLAAGGTMHGTALSTDSSVGVAYTHAMAQGDLTARLGWGVKQVSLNTAGMTGAGWSGVNLGLKWVGNA